MAEQEDTGFKITDRRKYNPDGSLRDSTGTQAAPAAADFAKPEAAPATGGSAPNNVVTFPTEAAPKQDEFAPPQPEPAPRLVENASESDAARAASAAENAAARQAESDYNRTRGPAAPGLPEASFLGLVNMLAVEAAMHLGLLRTAGEEAPQLDLESGRHLIDMLGMLQTKTRGNLTKEEDELLENVLADLRMQFVAISRRR
ncbi:MAG TPA: DUF1844 domain-containing protein [Blastocatellia bacterium]|nr:DUF1844 domain-containing protein [Blastocatellia bacterium]